MTAVLLKHGADWALSTFDGFSCSHSAAQAGHVAAVRLLLAAGAPINLSRKAEVAPA